MISQQETSPSEFHAPEKIVECSFHVLIYVRGVFSLENEPLGVVLFGIV